MILQLLNIMISSSLTITTFKEVLDFKYQAMNKIFLADQCLRGIRMSKAVKPRQHERRYWVMVETDSPQFVIASSS
ncbi:hypothetical protein Hanom_Chr17g01539171 [Helianthus anomalus]